MPFNDEPDDSEDDITVPLDYDASDENGKNAVVILLVMGLIIVLFALASPISRLIIGDSSSSFQENNQDTVRAARTEIQSALKDKSMYRVREVYKKYVPEYYDGSETLTEEAQVVVDELIVFYDNVYLALEYYDESLYDNTYSFLREQYGDLVINYANNIDTVWIHGDAYAPDELVDRVEKILVLSWQKASE